MLMLSLPQAAPLAQALADALNCAHSALHAHTFPDGETLVRIDAPVAGRQVVIVARMDHPDARTLPLLFAADAARELGARRVGLVAPYLPYMRQDDRFHPGEAITSRSYARLLSGAFDFLVTVDPHLHRWHSLDQIYTIPAAVVPAAPAIAQWLQREVARPLLVGPDSESSQWVADVARRLDAPWTVMAKLRHGDRDVQVQLHGDAGGRDRTPVLLDDIASSGQTLLQSVRALRAGGWPPPVCIAVHALCAPGMAQAFQDAGAQCFLSCDTVVHPSNVIGVGPLLVPALRQFTEAP